jgi:hypothetical protein
MRLGRLLLALLIASALVSAACGKSSKATTRPSTSARLEIVSPTPNERTGPNVKLRLNVIGGKVVARTGGKLTSDEGHVHVSVDGRLVSMAYGTEQDLTGLTVGTHSVEAEFVAIDHAPFKNRVIAAVLFTVGSS